MGVSVFYPHPATGNRGGHQEGAGFNPVGHHLVGCALQALHPFNGDGVGAGTGNFGTHFIQVIGQIGHFGFTRRIFQHRDAISKGGSHHQVFGAGYRHHFHHNARTFEAIGAGDDITVFNLDIGAHFLHALDMDIHRARADGTATGQGHFGITVAGQQRPQHQNR